MLVSELACPVVTLGMCSANSGLGQRIAVQDAVSICSQSLYSPLKSAFMPCQLLSQLSAVLVSACRGCLCTVLGHGLDAYTGAAADRRSRQGSPC